MVDSCGECVNCTKGEEQYCAQGMVGTYSSRERKSGAVTYGGSGNLTTPATGAFNGSVAVPAAAGSYTVYVRTCGGLQSSLTCAVGSTDITI